MGPVVNEKTIDKVIRQANHPALDQIVRDVDEIIDQGAGNDSVLLKTRERHPSRPVFHYARRAVSSSPVITASHVQAGTKSTMRVPGPGRLTELLVALSQVATSGSSTFSTLCPYVMFRTIPHTGQRRDRSASSSL